MEKVGFACELGVMELQIIWVIVHQRKMMQQVQKRQVRDRETRIRLNKVKGE